MVYSSLLEAWYILSAEDREKQTMDWISDPQTWIAFSTLLALEVVLGIDNVVFISILAAKLPAFEQTKARYLGLTLAMVMRIVLLFSISWGIGLTGPAFHRLCARDLGARPHPFDRRAVPHRQKHP
jgi:hypothetical protein